MLWWASLLFGGQLVIICGACGCDRDPAPSPSIGTANSGAIRTVRADSTGLLFTWVDDSGTFQVTEKVTEIPESARERVRVVSLNDPGTSPETVLVADLRQPGPDGTFPTRSMPRAAWEELSAHSRKSRLEALAPSASPPPSSSSPDPVTAGSTQVTLYGARWCKACRDAASYLKSKGIAVLEKDVDESRQVQAELQAKLSAARYPPTSSIPVIDIGGQILLGFDPAALDRALSKLMPAPR